MIPCQIFPNKGGNRFGAKIEINANDKTIIQKPSEPRKAPDGPQIAKCLFVANHNIAAVGIAKKAAASCPIMNLVTGPSAGCLFR